MDERAARRRNLELVKKDDLRTSSGVVPATDDGKAALPQAIRMGSLLEGKYLVGRVVGSGAVGIVFEAKNVELDETVAIKCLRPEMLVDKAMVGRFAREAKAAAAIKSEYVATVHDVGMTEGVPYIVMEYLEGKDLGTVVAESGPVSPRAAVEYALQVCEALAVAHSKGIVHRDIKPENLLLTERAGGMKIVKVLDFGISKAALTGSIFQNELPLVKTVNLMGTPLYMSPEQVRVSDSVDVRSDIWSLGMVIYEILTGATAFGGQSITEICAAILESPPDPIELHRTDLPSGLVDVITKCLQKDVTKRYQNVAELALALMPLGPKRTRLNVERAVAVLQASGHVDPRVRVNSTMPPPGSDLESVTIPKPPSAPVLGVTGEYASAPAAAISEPSLPATTSAGIGGGGKNESWAPPPKKKTPVGLVAAVLAIVLGAIGAVVFLLPRSSPEKGAPAATTEPTEPAQVQAKAASASTPAVATTSAAPAPPPADPAPPTASTSASAAPPAKPAWATAPRPTAKPSATASGAAGAASAKEPGKSNEEPDLGY